MLKFILFLFLSLLTLVLSSQVNLVPNSGFENIVSCDSVGLEGVNKGYVFPWDCPTEGTTDLFNSCSTNIGGGSPFNNFGYQIPNSQNGYIGFIVYSTLFPDYREYAQVRLDSSLEANKIYSIHFYINLSDSSAYAVRNIGIYFSSSHTNITSNLVLPYNPQIFATSFVSDTINWTLVSGTYTAFGGEQYIIIGNFFSNILTDTINFNNSKTFSFPHSYYYIDDVDVHCIDCDSVQSVTNISTNDLKFQILPNPSSGKFNINLKKHYRNISIQITDVLGKIVYTTALKESSQIPIELNATSGVYFITVIADDKRQVLKLVKE